MQVDEINQLIVIEFSRSKKVLYGSTIKDMLERNWNNPHRDCQPLLITGDSKQAYEFLKTMAAIAPGGYLVSYEEFLKEIGREKKTIVTELSGKSYDDLMNELNG